MYKATPRPKSKSRARSILHRENFKSTSLFLPSSPLRNLRKKTKNSDNNVDEIIVKNSTTNATHDKNKMKNNVTKKKTTTSTTARMMINNNTRTPSTTKAISKLKSNVKSTKKASTAVDIPITTTPRTMMKNNQMRNNNTLSNNILQLTTTTTATTDVTPETRRRRRRRFRRSAPFSLLARPISPVIEQNDVSKVYKEFFRTNLLLAKRLEDMKMKYTRTCARTHQLQKELLNVRTEISMFEQLQYQQQRVVSGGNDMKRHH